MGLFAYRLDSSKTAERLFADRKTWRNRVDSWWPRRNMRNFMKISVQLIREKPSRMSSTPLATSPACTTRLTAFISWSLIGAYTTTIYHGQDHSSGAFPTHPLIPRLLPGPPLNLLRQTRGVGVRLDDPPFGEFDMQLLGEGPAHAARPHIEPRPGLIPILDPNLGRGTKKLEQLSSRGHPAPDHRRSRRRELRTHRDTPGHEQEETPNAH